MPLLHFFSKCSRTDTCTEFAQGKVDPVEAGKKGGHTSGIGGSAEEDTSSSGNSGGSKKGGMLSFQLSSALTRIH